MPAWLTMPDSTGTGTYVLAAWLFLRLLGLVYLAAFVSLALQIKGLVGSQGILPACEFLARQRSAGFARFWQTPTLCWLSSRDGFLSGLAWGGAALSLLLIIGLAPIPVLLLLWLCYLSLFTVCRLFLSYQWDTLLLETGFLAIFIAPTDWLPRLPHAAPSPLAIWLFWWLLFRLMFFSGVVKWRSRDPTWRNLTALSFHYETQPLPTPLAWHAHHLPLRFHRTCAAAMFAIELIASFLLLGPASWRCAAATLFTLLMVSIFLTGNYCFFNLLGIALCVLLLNDNVLAPVLNPLWSSPPLVGATQPPTWYLWMPAGAAALVLLLSVEIVLRLFRAEPKWPRQLRSVFEVLERLRLVNSYGLFAVMTIERPELVVEGSRDGRAWEAYEFKWKPGDVKRAPRFIAPHQPRLDWQMWFAALGYFPNHPWVGRLLTRLLQGSPAVLGLLRTNPFPGSPPRFVRVVIYDYRFSTRAERRATGAWWVRDRRGLYCPPVEARGEHNNADAHPPVR